MRAWLGLVVLMAACGRGESQPAPTTATSGGPHALPSAADAVWPSVPTGTTEDGATWQTIRHGTVHTHVALPPGFGVELGTLPLGHPVVRLRDADLTIEITYSSGRPRFATTGRTPASVSDVHRVATDVNVTMAYTARGVRRVLGWTRSTQCEAQGVTPANEDVAFRICASMQLPHPGALRPPAQQPGAPAPWLPQPEYATVETGGTVRRIHAGHFSVQVNSRGPCPSADALRESHGTGFDVQPRALPNGPALQGQLYELLDGERWPSGVAIWATRAHHCCMATIPGEPPPSEAQVTYVAELCDALGQASAAPAAPASAAAPAVPTPRSLEARRGDAVVSLTEGTGFLIDANAPPPPPGTTIRPHPSLHGSCGGGDIPACSEAGAVVRGATTLQQVQAGLEARGFTVTIAP